MTVCMYLYGTVGSGKELLKNIKSLTDTSVLSTLVDNPGDSRVWTVSSDLKIRVRNLPDNQQSLPFLVDLTIRP